MGFVDATKSGFSKFITFSGRARRSEFWFFFLFLMLAGIVIGIIDSAIFGPTTVTGVSTTFDADGSLTESNWKEVRYGSGPLSDLWGLITLLPLLSLGWRRLHDTGRPGWYFVVPIIISIILVLGLFASSGIFGAQTTQDALKALQGIGPGRFIFVWLACAGSFVTLLVMLCRKSTPGPNRYGPNPLEATP